MRVPQNDLMAITVTLSTGLRAWITDNLSRGAPRATMIETLVGRDFDPRIARGLVDAFVSAHADGRPLPEHSVALDMEAPRYQYETPRIGAGNVIDAAGRPVRVLLRLQQPVLVTLEQLFTDQECERLIELSIPRLRRSTVDNTKAASTVEDYRTSDGAFFRLRENPLIRQLDERVSACMNCPVENGEGLQVLRYGPGDSFAPHFDFLLPSNAHNSASIARSGQRISTLIVYLNDVPEGGETVFPKLGLSITPRRGNALYFEYTNSHMQVDQLSLHAGAPVTRGEKWVVNKWMRARRFVSAAESERTSTGT
jgi:prolyl 4-hydroxylase